MAANDAFMQEFNTWIDLLTQFPESSRQDFPYRDLSNIVLSDTTLVDRALDRINFQEANISKLNMKLCSAVECDFSSANLSGMRAEGCDFSRARFDLAELSKSKFSHCNFSHAVITSADLSDCEFSECNFSNALLLDCNLSHANLSGSDFKRARMNGSDLTGSVLDHANLYDTILTQSQLNSAKSKIETIFSNPPAGRDDTILVEMVRMNIFIPLQVAKSLELIAKQAGLSEEDLGIKAIYDLIISVNMGHPVTKELL